jgi:hypothetical protein
MTKALDVKTVVAVSRKYGAWGRGTTVAEAERFMRKEGDRRAKADVFYFFDCERDQVKIECGVDFSVWWPKGVTAMRMEVP